MTARTTPKLPEPATGAMKVVAWLDDGLSARNGSEGTSFRVVTEQTRQNMPRSAVAAYTDPLVRLSDAQALAGEVERLRARLAFLTDPEALRFVEKDSGFYRVYEDKASSENALHFWQSMTYLFYPTAEEAIDAAIDASRAVATQEAK